MIDEEIAQPLAPRHAPRIMRYRNQTHRVERTQQRRQDKLKTLGVQFLEKDAEVPLGDGVKAVEGIAYLKDSRYRKIGAGEPHRRVVFFEVLPPSAESSDQIATVESEGKRAGPVTAP